MIRAPTFAMSKGPAAKPAGDANVVHESEAQRQHVRVRLPGFVEFDASGQRLRCRLFDLSAGGFSCEAPHAGLRPGMGLRGNLIVNMEPIGFTLPVAFQVRNADARNGRIGCRFQDLGPREVGALRHLITSFLSGEVVGVGDVLHNASRGNFTRPRPAPRDAGGQSSGGRLRAMVLSVAALVMGVTAFGYALGQVHHLLFVTSASAGKVAGPVYSVSMPREGTFYSLVPDDGVVKKGAALASFEAPVLDLVRGQALSANFTPEQLNRMLSQMVKGTITSPCDCRVQTQFVANAQYVGRGQPLFELVPRELKNPYVMARFRFDQVDKLPPGTQVRFHVTGDSQERVGRISQLRVPSQGDTVGGDVIAMIEPSEPLPPDLVNRPAAVDAGGLAKLSLMSIVSSMASGDGD